MIKYSANNPTVTPNIVFVNSALVTAFNSAVSTIRRVHYEFVEGVNLSRKRVLRRNNDFSNSTNNSAGESEGEDLSYRGRGGKSSFQELLLRRAGSV